MFNQDVFDKLKELAVEFKADAVDFTKRLIQVPSISGEEGELTELLLQEMEKLGYDEYFRDDMGNIIGLVKGTEDGPTIMYNSHMDHVDPGDPNNWEGYDPYGGEIDICKCDNQDRTAMDDTECIHGRGASDVKSGHAFQIYAGAAIVRLREMGYKFKGTFMYSGVVQEEPAEMIGMAHKIDKTFPAKGLTYDAMVSSEATSLKLYLGHRGRVEFLAKIYGRTSHGSAPWLGINSIYKSMPVIAKIKDELYPSLPTDKDLGQASISLNIIECLPGALSIVPDVTMLSLDRRTIPGETAESAMAEIQAILDEVAKEDSEFRADVVVKSALERCYTGMETDAPKDMAPWKMGVNHPFTQVCANAIEAVGLEVKYGYWDFGTDGSKTAGIDRKPTIGFSGMQEHFAHTPYDKVRTDFIEKAIAGNAAIYIKASECGKETFRLLDF